MAIKRCKQFPKGISLIDTMVAITALAIAVLGASSFKYYTTIEVRKATSRADAARLALTLCESWKGLDGDLTYDPVTALSSQLTISTSANGPTEPNEFTELAKCVITFDEVNYFITLSYNDVDTGLRALNTSVCWSHRQYGEDEKIFADAILSLELTTYALP